MSPIRRPVAQPVPEAAARPVCEAASEPFLAAAPEPVVRAAPARRDPALDGLRGLAVLLVYLFHYGGGNQSTHRVTRLFGYVSQAGWIGVELFFALSGFLITGLLWPDLERNTGLANVRRGAAIRSFYARRARRIVPVYALALLAAAVVAMLSVATRATEAPSSIWPNPAEPLLVYLSFLQNVPAFVATALRFPPPLPLHHLWTVAVEVQFYLIWPVLLLLARTRGRAIQVCGGTFLLACVFRAIVFWPDRHVPGTVPDWSPFLLTRIGALALGSALALLEPAQLIRSVRRWAVPMLLLSSALFCTTGRFFHNLLLAQEGQFIVSLPLAEVACTALLALALQPGPWRTVLKARLLCFLGRISYGFYVFHILLEPGFDQIGAAICHAHTGTGYLLVRFVVAFPVSAAVAWVSFQFFEQPILRWRWSPRNLPTLAPCAQTR